MAKKTEKIDIDIIDDFKHLKPKMTSEEINEEFKQARLDGTTSVFDVLKAFWDSEKWIEISDADKIASAKYINNRLLFLFPKKVMELNKFGISELFIVEYWRHIMFSFFKEFPSILYTKVAQDEKDVQEAENTVEYQIEQFENEFKWELIRRERVDWKTFEEMVRRIPEKVLEELNHIKLISSNDYKDMKANLKEVEESFVLNYIETDDLALELLNDFMSDDED